MCCVKLEYVCAETELYVCMLCLSDYFGNDERKTNKIGNFGESLTLSCVINRIYHWSSMQTEKSQPEGKRIMPKTGFTKVSGIIR